jgi:hypothetical protein
MSLHGHQAGENAGALRPSRFGHVTIAQQEKSEWRKSVDVRQAVFRRSFWRKKKPQNLPSRQAGRKQEPRNPQRLRHYQTEDRTPMRAGGDNATG